ncbi:MAG: two-component sensor histidine kinase [Chitinophagales bacterium]|nr:MAG: two-component sensor histidine kinase [Chitinophagales bacterium]
MLILSVGNLFYPQWYHWSLIILIPACTFVISFVLFFYTLEKFIYRKIKLIYKSIYQQKAPRGAESNGKRDLMNKNILGEVEQEVAAWASRQTQEIEMLRQMANFRKEFLGNVSHELKTPIFTIQGYLHTLIDGALDDPQVNKNYLIKASENLERLTNIVHDLEVISQIESNTLLLDMSRFDVVRLIREVVEDMQIKARTKSITITLKEGADQPAYVFADRDRIRQVLNNLIANSIRYGIEGGKTTIGVYDMDENVLVEVSDNGIGIAQEHLPRLFERFYRVDKSRSRELGGTGLGLSIVKHIIEAHGQTINVRSTPKVGSTFGFTLKKA